MEEKRRVDEALQPMSLDLNTPAENTVPSSAQVVSPSGEGKLETELKPVAEEEDK